MSKYLDELIEKHLAEINKLSDEEVRHYLRFSMIK